jgi:hypothetical protein
MVAPMTRGDAAASPAVVDALRPAALRDRLDRDGGFTVAVTTGALVERGIAVCLRPSASWTFPRSDWSDDAVARWVAEHAASRTCRTIGGWLDSGRVWLDPVRVMPVALGPVASALGRRLGQRAAFDLRRRRLVPLAPRS